VKLGEKRERRGVQNLGGFKREMLRWAQNDK
jgi:hypothetical protein